MAKQPSSHPPVQTGIARPASSVLLAPARALSSHARRIYGERYQGRYRYAPVIFAFDAFLAGVALSLLGINLFLWIFTSPRNPGLEATVYAPVIIASETVPVEVVVKATDGRMHRGVALTWEFAPSTEVQAMSPPAGLLGSVQLGDIAPFGEAHAKVRIRVHAEVGAAVPLRFRLVEGMWGNSIQGGDVRHVESGVLRADPEVQTDEVFPGASIPLRIQNTGTEDIGPMALRLIRASGAEAHFGNGDNVMQIEQLPAGSSRNIRIQLGTELADSIHLAWQIEQAGRIVYRKSANWKPASGKIPKITVQKNAQGFDILGDADQDIVLLNASKQIEVKKNQSIQIETNAVSSDGVLFAYLIQDEAKQLMPFIQIPVPIKLPFEAEARYYSATGDQLGIGSHPPRVGEITSYWIFWRVGPAPQEIKDVRIQAQLSPGVTRTGAFTSSLSSNAAGDRQSVDWRLPRLELGQTADFGMEVQLEPRPEQAGSILQLLSTSTITSLSEKIEVPPLTTELKTDIKAKSDGIVLPRQGE